MGENLTPSNREKVASCYSPLSVLICSSDSWILVLLQNFSKIAVIKSSEIERLS